MIEESEGADTEGTEGVEANGGGAEAEGWWNSRAEADGWWNNRGEKIQVAK